MIGAPPLIVGADQVTFALAFPPTATTVVGGFGFVAGTTAAVAVDGTDGPTLFIAITVNVYDVPFVRLVIIAVVVFPSVFATKPPGLDVTV